MSQMEGQITTECKQCVVESVYSPLQTADADIGDKVVRDFRLQIFGTPGFSVPDSCSGGGFLMDSPALFAGNGPVGVSLKFGLVWEI
jgi:hypothetical protein